ncbi:D-alanyl-D-alanine carboxypeptidase/D-alanyl-D-alanine endopeptidase [Schlesneria paludicola]|uniref:D-alanyl-D-alanine carboxypeptidase/D-alanyl-D-alanine endopeptidase n=1 Tax=Schlesneria paludicola TaxID=360056 RepID=UPI00029AF4B5|nr:D-alanyl-D-alanine carboxypeptidase/D-alanyl-D-alanine-endopeptidase [Schlesneria paludicola]
MASTCRQVSFECFLKRSTRLWKRIPIVLIVAMASGAWHPVRAQDSLPGAIQRITHQAHFKQAHWGALFVDQQSGRVIYKHDDEKLFIPASTTKLYTVACALEALGPDYQFVTPVVRKGEINEHGELKGDLILVASGDLSFGGRTTPDGKMAFANVDHTYANGNLEAELTAPDPLEGLNDLARQVAAAGIKHVHGEILIDDRLFEQAESSGSGPTKVTPCMVNDNLIDLLFTPTDVGQRAVCTWRPQSEGVRVESKVTTVNSGKSLDIKIRDLGHGRISVTGKIPYGHKPVLKVQEVHDARAFARTLFIEALHRVGVSVDAATVSEATTSELPGVADVHQLPQVAVHRSLPLSESAKLILKVSHNLQASTLPLLVACKHGERTLTAGLKQQHAFLKHAHVDVDTISLAGGAGGSRADLITPHATVQLLRYMTTQPSFPVFHSALPRLGVDGTLAKNIAHDSPARDKVHAKTGSLYWDNTMNGSSVMTSKALAGYMTTAKGRQVIFAMFVNYAHLGHGVTVKTFGDDLGKICETVYLHE